MTFIETIISGAVGLMLSSGAFYLRNLENRMRDLRKDVLTKPTKQEVSELIDLKNEPLKVSHRDIKEDIKELKDKIDKLIQLQLDKD